METCAPLYKGAGLAADIRHVNAKFLNPNAKIMFLWALLCFWCLVQNSMGNSKEDVVQRLKQRLRIGESWLTGKSVKYSDIQEKYSDCLAQSKLAVLIRPKRLIGPSSSRQQIFEFTSTNHKNIPINALVQNATVWFPAHILNKAIKIHFMHCYQVDQKSWELVEKRYNQKRDNHTHTHSFNIKNIFETYKFRENEKENFGHLIAILQYSSNIVHRHEVIGQHENDHTTLHLHTSLQKPSFHLIYSEPKKIISHSNKGRQISTKLCDDLDDDGPKECCLKTMDIEFAHKNWSWHWVAEPKTMRIHYCDGNCPHPYDNMETNEAMFRQLIEYTQRPAVGQLCCVASGYRRRHVTMKTSRPGLKLTISLEDIDASSCSCIS